MRKQECLLLKRAGAIDDGDGIELYGMEELLQIYQQCF
jgi:hypothetical protein